MSIKYEVHNIENAVGTGEKRKYVQLKTMKPKTMDELASQIAHSCSLTASDVKAVMSELRQVAVEDLSSGIRFHLPELGYLSLAVGNTPTDKLPEGKITGKDIFLKNINFQPESSFLRDVRGKVRFEKSKYSSASTSYSEEELWQRIEAYLKENKHITRRTMREQFGLSEHIAKLWLGKFVEEGRLVKDVFGRQQIYSLA